MTSILKVDELQDTSGNLIIKEDSNTITIGASGDTVDIPSGATFDATGATITGITQGITMADSWRITANANINGSVQLTSNWERTDTYGFGQLGTGMTESSGTFTFPSTGIYFVQFETSCNGNGNARSYIGARIYTTTNNSSYNAASYSYNSAYTSGAYGSPMTSFIFDVTDTSTHKVRFYGDTPGDVTYEGSTNDDKTCVRFIRLGDT
jgi:hypothetical protein